MPAVYYYSKNGEYASMEFLPVLPAEIRSGTLEPPDFLTGFRPVWNGEAWEQKPDFRKKSGFVNGVYTVIKELGPLPEGWSDDLPAVEFEPDPGAEIISELREILLRLKELDSKSTRPLRDYGLGIDREAALARLQGYEDQAEALRLRIAELDPAGEYINAIYI
jgi:hypothetical protein